jgi:hypothetical protein
LGLGVDPVKILEDQAQWLNLALAEQEPFDRVVGVPTPPGRVEDLPGGVVDRNV